MPRAPPIPVDQRTALELDAIAVAYRALFPLDQVIRAWRDHGHRGLLEPLLSLWPRVNCPADCVVLAMPSTEFAIRHRGEDPLSRLAASYAHRLDRPWVRAYRLNSNERAPKARGNEQGLSLPQFSLPSGLQKILIIDDVLGTGETLRGLTRTLRAQGVVWLGAAILAYRQSERSGLIHSDP